MGRTATLKARRRQQRTLTEADLTRTKAEMREAAHDTSRMTPEGEALGAELVRLTEPVIARLAAEGEPDVRCDTCAFRRGTVPNGCAETVLDAAKAVFEGDVFLCHMRLAERATCHGWYAGRVAVHGDRTLVGYPYSHEVKGD